MRTIRSAQSSPGKVIFARLRNTSNVNVNLFSIFTSYLLTRQRRDWRREWNIIIRVLSARREMFQERFTTSQLVGTNKFEINTSVDTPTTAWYVCGEPSSGLPRQIIFVQPNPYIQMENNNPVKKPITNRAQRRKYWIFRCIARILVESSKRLHCDLQNSFNRRHGYPLPITLCNNGRF